MSWYRPRLEIERVEQAPRPRVARHPAPVPRTAPRAGVAASNAKILNAKTSNTKRAATPSLAAQTTPKEIPAATATMTAEKAVEKAVAGGEVPERKLESSDRVEPAQEASIAASPPAEAPKSEIKPEPEIKSEAAATPPAEAEITVPPATLEIAALPAAAAAPASAPRTMQEQVVEATGMADRVTAITVARQPAGPSDNPEREPAERQRCRQDGIRIARQFGQSGSACPGASGDQFAIRPEQQEHRDRGEAIRRKRQRQRRADGGGRR